MIPRTTLARWRTSPIAFIQQVLIDPETKRPFVLLELGAQLPHACIRRDCRWAATLPRADLLVP